MSRRYLSLDRKAGRFPRHPAPLMVEDACLVSCPWIGFATTVLLGIIYPLVVTGIAQVLFPKKANGQLIEANGKIIGSRVIAQAFTAPGYFHPRPSAVNYDPTGSNGS